MNAIPVFIGYDPREAIVFHVCVNSIIRHASRPVAIVPLALNLLDAYREEHADGSNDFTYSRFLVPYLTGFRGRAIYMDGDMTVQGDIAELYDSLSADHDVAVVKHDYRTRQTDKYLGNTNQDYPRKNWSSVIVWNCNSFPNRVLTPEFVQEQTGSFLHRFSWLKDDRIQSLPPDWNWLPDELGSRPSAKLLHWTLGSPCFPEYSDTPDADIWKREHALTIQPIETR